MPSSLPQRIDPAAAPAMAVGAVPTLLAALAGHRRTAAALACCPLGVAAFFRDPDRTPDHRQVDPDLVLAPADGKVMYAGPAQVGVAPAGHWQQVSIFLSLFDVHINRTPYARTRRGGHLPPGQVARGLPVRERDRERAQRDHPEPTPSTARSGAWSSARSSGLVARRVVTRVAPGDVLRTGQRIGLMKFGSRMDVFVPPGRRAGRRRRATAPSPARPSSPGGPRSAREHPLTPATEKPDRRLLDRWRLKSPSGAAVVSLRQLGPKERLRVTAPSMFTTGNMACGFSAILLAFADHFTWAAAMLAGSIVLDIADGAVARLVGATSPFGVQLDSLADLVSFGLAPAVLVHTWALPENPVLAWLSAFFWLACAAFRLARFNVTVDPLADKKYFVGLPSPGATLVVIATIVALRTSEHGPWMLVPVGVSVVPALLMITTVRFRSFRGLLSPRTRQARAVTTGAGARPWSSDWSLDAATTGLVVACAYLLTAPLGV